MERALFAGVHVGRSDGGCEGGGEREGRADQGRGGQGGKGEKGVFAPRGEGKGGGRPKEKKRGESREDDEGKA